MRVLETRGAHYVDEAAQLWAEATAARDRRTDVAGLDDSRPIISSVVESSTRSILFVGLSGDQQVLAFAAVEPLAGGVESEAEIRYVGVRPTLWNHGLAAQLLEEMKARLPALGFTAAELLVYIDNRRAVALYERLGWIQVGEPSPHPRTARLEQRYRIELDGSHAPDDLVGSA
jgi:ribosomal protein S18 acetylase RimI-like enzyme